jgi:hypothetical protein
LQKRISTGQKIFFITGKSFQKKSSLSVQWIKMPGRNNKDAPVGPRGITALLNDRDRNTQVMRED